jgi:hypothetical protein
MSRRHRAARYYAEDSSLTEAIPQILRCSGIGTRCDRPDVGFVAALVAAVVDAWIAPADSIMRDGEDVVCCALALPDCQPIGIDPRGLTARVQPIYLWPYTKRLIYPLAARLVQLTN